MVFFQSLFRYFLLSSLVLFAACSSNEGTKSSLREALTFYASFDVEANADFAKGDPILYSVVATKPELKTKVGLPDEVVMKESGGDFGQCLSFNTPEGVSGTRAYFKLKGNFPYEDRDWSGTVSFWLRVSPLEDLRPGFTDPIQLTSKSALDAGIWVDFDREATRQFRMGAFADRAIWNPEKRKVSEIPNSERPMVPEKQPSFSRDRWTHVAVTIEGFNNPGTDGVATLYLDGELQGALESWQQRYTWDHDLAQIRLGVNFVGDLDELSCFDRALSSEEVKALHSLGKELGSLVSSH